MFTASCVKDYYQILGVPDTAGPEEIKQAYRNLAKRYHPDRNQGNTHSEETFKEITQAYQVLSDPELRRKFDLKRAYHSHRYENVRKGKSENATTEEKKRTSHAAYGKKQAKSREETRSERLTSYLFGGALVFFAALMITMLIVGPWNQEEDPHSNLDRIKPPDFSNRPAIYSADSPYDSIFGGSWILEGNHNSVIVVNTNQAEAVVCLQETNPPYRTIRNEYLEPGDSYRLNAIPQGTYYLKAYFGRDWDPELLLFNGKVKGGFRRSYGYYKSDKKENLFTITHENAGEHLRFTTYQAYLATLFKQPGKEISEEEFFR
ncbi:MAG: J domain-containing protein [Bacteroidia bacterium]|nr:J domain-containing protein [Bacteroidia bacterium]